jgi:hypothetical protein
MVLSPYYVSNIIIPEIYIDDNLTTKFIELTYKDQHQKYKKYKKATKKYAKINTPAPKDDFSDRIECHIPNEPDHARYSGDLYKYGPKKK